MAAARCVRQLRAVDGKFEVGRHRVRKPDASHGPMEARRIRRPRTSTPRPDASDLPYICSRGLRSDPAKGKGAGLVMPWCDTDAMAAHLIEISAAVDPGAHAVLIVDQAGWHLTPKLAIPDNITVLALPPRSPELNPVENVWQFMRDNWFIEPDLQILRRHRRAVLPSLEQPHRPTMEDHVPRHAQMGAWVLINDRWYNASATRSSAGPSYGLPGQPPNTAYRITLSGLVLLRPGGLILLRR